MPTAAPTPTANPVKIGDLSARLGLAPDTRIRDNLGRPTAIKDLVG